MWGPKSDQETTTVKRLQTRLLCVIRVFQTPKVVGCCLPGVSPRAKCLASGGSASYASHDIVSRFAIPVLRCRRGGRHEDVPSEMANHA